MQTTNFFSLLNETNIQNVNLNITSNQDGTTTLVVTSSPTTSKDQALNSLKPIVVTNTIENLDKGFFTTIGNELKERQFLYSNIETIEKDRLEKEKQTKVAKELKGKEKKLLEQLENLLKDKTFSAKEPEKKKKADKLITEILELNPDSKKAKEIKIELDKEAAELTMF